jgi:hypothetical protein
MAQLMYESPFQIRSATGDPVRPEFPHRKKMTPSLHRIILVTRLKSMSTMTVSRVTVHFIVAPHGQWLPSALLLKSHFNNPPHPQAALIARKIKYRVLGGLSLTDKKEVKSSFVLLCLFIAP